MATAAFNRLESAELGLLDALVKIRNAKRVEADKEAARLPRGADLLRKAGDPASIDVNGRLFHRQTDGTYREVARDPTERVYISGTGGGRAAAETEERAMKMIRRTAVVGHVMPRPAR
jgi:hypothetical protein